MTLKRILFVALAATIALRLAPLLLPIVWPGLRGSLERMRRRADVGAALVMAALALATFRQGQPWLGGLVLVLGIPAFVAAGGVLVEALRRR